MRSSRIFLLHGMGRSVASMLILAGRLQRVGHRPSLFGYSVSRDKLGDISARFKEHVRVVLSADAAEAAGVDAGTDSGRAPLPYSVVGHSLGNVVVRMTLPEMSPGLRRLVMLAPPNRPPVSARYLERNAVFRRLTQEAGRRLLDPDFFAALPPPGVPVLVVAGTAGPRLPWLPFGGEPNDGVLLVSETHLAGARQLEVDGYHTFLMNRRDVFHAVAGFLADQEADHR